MASNCQSASIKRKAQVILSCQLCQRSLPLKWKCIDCDILMCDNCKINVHSRVKTATRHKIVDIKEIDFTDPKQPSVDLDNIPCKAHPTQSSCVYCVQCKELICPKCLTKTHKGHDVDEIETKYNENLEYLQKYSSGNTDPQDLSVIFGSFDRLSIITNPEEIKMTKIKTYKTGFPIIDELVTTSVNSLWVACCQTTSLQEMQIGQELTTRREFNDIDIYDMTLSKAGDILFTLPGDTHLFRLSKTGQMIIVHDFSPLLPKAILVTDNSILVSTREKGEPWPLTKHSRRQIVVLDQSGKKKMNVIEYDRHNKRLFSLISRMTMDKMGNIIAIDCPSNVVDKIVKVVNNAIAWIYAGNSDINTDEVTFYASNLSVTKAGNFIVTDTKTNSLHILSGEGIAIKCCLLKNLNILLPHCLHIDFNGNLWIGCCKDTNSKENANIYKLEISGC